ncbi:MAG: hypothetical protein Q9173_006737, partial [Seirophora scorigena]
IESDLSAADETKFKEKNRRFWNLGRHYFQVEYEVKVLIGPADVRFELWFDNQKLSKDHPIKVEWASAPAATSTATEMPDTSIGMAPSAELQGEGGDGDSVGNRGEAGRPGPGPIRQLPDGVAVVPVPPPPPKKHKDWGRMF